MALDFSGYEAARRLHAYLLRHHWREHRLIGPDPGIRFNSRIGRFLKSYLGFLPWRDDLVYMQAQGYWVLANWLLWDRTGEADCRDVAVACARYILACQRADGAWVYPNPEWKGRVATAEGTWSALGLVETYRQTGDREFLQGALRWYQCLVETIKFERVGEELAINYFANLGRARVPNNSVMVLRFLAELAELTGDPDYLQHVPGLLLFLQRAQRDSGEFPYVAPDARQGGRVHFQCYQYNAFEFLDLTRYFQLQGQTGLPPLAARLLRFLRGGQRPGGSAYFACDNRYRTVVYHTAVLAAAFRAAQQRGAADCGPLADRGYARLRRWQRGDGSFPYSQGDYRVLRDRRSYPRYLAMILLHLLLDDPVPAAQGLRSGASEQPRTAASPPALGSAPVVQGGG